jgi:hypothetical protein
MAAGCRGTGLPRAQSKFAEMYADGPAGIIRLAGLPMIFPNNARKRKSDVTRRSHGEFNTIDLASFHIVTTYMDLKTREGGSRGHFKK